MWYIYKRMCVRARVRVHTWKHMWICHISVGCFQAQKSLSTDETAKPSDSAREQTSTLTPQLNATPEKDRDALLDENDGASSGKLVVQTDNEQQLYMENGSQILDIPITETLADDLGKDNANHVEVPVTVTDAEAVASTSNGERLNGSASEEQPPAKGVEVANETHLLDDTQSNKSGGSDVPPKIDQEGSDSIIIDPLSNTETQAKPGDVKIVSMSNQKKQNEHKAGKVQEQLDEVK